MSSTLRVWRRVQDAASEFTVEIYQPKPHCNIYKERETLGLDKLGGYRDTKGLSLRNQIYISLIPIMSI